MTDFQRGDRRGDWLARLDAAAETFADPLSRGVRGRSWWPWVLLGEPVLGASHWHPEAPSPEEALR